MGANFTLNFPASRWAAWISYLERISKPCYSCKYKPAALARVEKYANSLAPRVVLVLVLKYALVNTE